MTQDPKGTWLFLYLVLGRLLLKYDLQSCCPHFKKDVWSGKRFTEMIQTEFEMWKLYRKIDSLKNLSSYPV